VSPKYTKLSFGNLARNARKTVSPPTPESNTPMGAELRRSDFDSIDRSAGPVVACIESKMESAVIQSS
jgi:hypothetical protein